jgi:hypothetical protein
MTTGFSGQHTAAAEPDQYLNFISKEEPMMKTLLSIVACFMMIVSSLSQQALASSHEEKANAEQLFESKCSLCHSIDRPKSKKKSKEGWETTVMRMKNKNGCPITDEEAQMIIDYLADKYGI